MKTRRPPPPPHLPFALVDSGPRGLRLAAVNATARSFGLTIGQRLADARAAVPDLLSEPHAPEEDMASLLGLCRWLERYSPWVAPEAPDGVLLDVTGVAHLFGGEPAMIDGLRRRLAAYGFTLRAGLGDTIGAAWALARYGGERFEALPVEALRIDADSARTLRRLGLKTVGALRDIPRAALARRFRGETIAANVLMRLDELTGQRDEPLNALNPPTSFIAHQPLSEPLISHEGLEAVLTRAVASLARALEREARGATRLILKLFRCDGSRLNIPAGFATPTHDAAHLLRILRPKLETIDAGFGIDALTLEARETAPAPLHQPGFMEDGATRALEELNDRVLNRGDAGLSRLEAVESHIPERAEQARAPSSASASHERAPQANEAAARPLLIFERAEPARVIAAVPDGPPMRFTWRRVTRRVVKSDGPERIAPEWWRLAASERPRDYYRIEDETGRRYWLYREGLYGETDGAAPQWFVHGLSP